MAYIHNGLQGKIGTAKRRDGTIQEIHVYKNSSDFPENNLLILSGTEDGKFQTERVPITEEIWQIIGECFGYRFRKIIEEKKNINQEKETI